MTCRHLSISMVLDNLSTFMQVRVLDANLSDEQEEKLLWLLHVVLWLTRT